MGDRAMCHIRIGGQLPASLVASFSKLVADYDLRNDWSGDDAVIPVSGSCQSLDLYGEDLNGGTVPALEQFCRQHHLPFWRWSGGCHGAFTPALYAWYGEGDEHSIDASDDEQPMFSASDIEKASSVELLRDIVAQFNRPLPPFEIVNQPAMDPETTAYLAEIKQRALQGFPLSRVTREFHDAQLNCLPPVYRRGTPGFFISEAYTERVHAQFAEYRGNFYGAYVDIDDPQSVIDQRKLEAFHALHQDDEPLSWYPDLSKASAI